MNKQLKQFQQHLGEMLKALDVFCRDNQLELFLVGGSALGAYRHEGFIPWDDDIDIAMMRNDFEKLEKHMEAQGNMLGKLTYSPAETPIIPEAPIGHLYDLNATVAGKEHAPKIDIHPIDGVPETKREQRLQKFLTQVYYLGVYHLPTKNKGKAWNIVTKILLFIIPEFAWKILLQKSKQYITKWDDKCAVNVCSLFGVAGYEREVMPKAWIFPLADKKFGNHTFYAPGNGSVYLQRLYGDWEALPPVEKRVPVHESYLYYKEEPGK